MDAKIWLLHVDPGCFTLCDVGQVSLTTLKRSKEESWAMSSLRFSAIAVTLFVVGAVSPRAHAQKACEQLTPDVLAANAVPAVSRVMGNGCRFVTTSVGRGQSRPGEMEIVPAKLTSASADDFDKLQNDWFAQHQRRCGLEIGLGKKAAWCGTGSVESLDYELIILRGNTISAIILHNWVRPPNPSRMMAIKLAQDIFGPAPDDAPLVRPKD